MVLGNCFLILLLLQKVLVHVRNVFSVCCFYKNGPTQASFSFIFGLFKQTIQFLIHINVKNVMSIQYMVLGFEPTTFRTWVYFLNIRDAINGHILPIRDVNTEINLSKKECCFYFKMGNPRPLFNLFSVFFKRHYNFYNKFMWKNVHPVYGTGIQTHNL